MNQIAIVPHLHVIDLEQSIEFYCELLGFQIDWIDESNGVQQAMLRLYDDAILFSRSGDSGKRVSGELVFYVGDVDELYEEIRDDVFVMQPPSSGEGTRVFRFRDCNGYDLVFVRIEQEMDETIVQRPGKRRGFLQFGESWFCSDDGSGSVHFPAPFRDP